ncbi:hypothetical protein BDZ89DRAFT_1095452 [Hymenopellis radicata]|nr:hypothetical protein BDZ89DRAFT_1095452 [Hymenopellis radicata]
MTWLNHCLTPYVARLGIIPETQVATQQGVQARDLVSFLSGIKTWAQRHKAEVWCLKRDQMKGFDYLAPQGFHDAVAAYGLPASIIELDRAAQDNVKCSIRTAHGMTEPIFISGVTKQSGPLSPLKSTLTTSLGHRWLSDLAADSESSLVLRSSNMERGDPHLPNDRTELRIAMAEAMDDSYLFARDEAGLMYFTLSMERFQFALEFLRAKVDDPTARYDELKCFIDEFTMPKFTLRTPITLVRRILVQNVLSRARALLALQPILQADAERLDSLTPCGGELARDLNHHIDAYRKMARITLADWQCSINGCVNPLDGAGLERRFSRYRGRLPSAWITAQQAMRDPGVMLSLRSTDQSHVLRGDMSLTHVSADVPHGRTWVSLRKRGVSLLCHVASPASAGLLDPKTLIAVITGPRTLVMRVAGVAKSILHAEVFGQIMDSLIASDLEPNTHQRLLTNHLNSVRLVNDSQMVIDMQPLHTNGDSTESRLNHEADHYASGSQAVSTRLPIAPEPTFFMNDFTFFSDAHGWIESDIKTYLLSAFARLTSREFGFERKYRMATWLYDKRPPPSYPYTHAVSAYSAAVQLYARSGQLPNAEIMHTRNYLASSLCRFGCIATEDMHHTFVHCPRFSACRAEALKDIERVTEN